MYDFQNNDINLSGNPGGVKTDTIVVKKSTPKKKTTNSTTTSCTITITNSVNNTNGMYDFYCTGGL